MRELDSHPGADGGVRFFESEGRTRLALVSGGGLLKIWNADDWSTFGEYPARKAVDAIMPLAVSRGNSLLAWPQSSWDLRTGQQRGTLRGHTDSISALMFSPDGRTLVSSSADNTVRLWRTQRRK